jgi:hypothetical protein
MTNPMDEVPDEARDEVEALFNQLEESIDAGQIEYDAGVAAIVQLYRSFRAAGLDRQDAAALTAALTLGGGAK